jgi:ABC-type multidrug transport system ATPase subunit
MPLHVLGLVHTRHDRGEGFSRGMKQKVALAGALIHDPNCSCWMSRGPALMPRSRVG